MIRSRFNKWREENWKMRYGAERPADFVEYYMRYWFTFCLTLSGSIMVLAMFIPAPLAIYSLSVPTYQICVGIYMLIFFVWLIARIRRPIISIKGQAPEKVTAGEVFRSEFVLENKGKSTVYELGVGYFLIPTKGLKAHTIPFWKKMLSRYGMGMILPQKMEIVDDGGLIRSLGSGETCRVSIEAKYFRRGVYTMPPLWAYSEFPFNLVRVKSRLTKEYMHYERNAITVLPSFKPAEAIEIPPSKNYQPGGIALTSSIGESPEYIGSREYRYGDNVRHIDFRAWARTGAPVVREFQEEYYSRIALVMDTFVPDHEKLTKHGYPDLEGAVQLSAAIADALSNGEYIIDLFAAGPDLYVFRSGRHTAHFDNVLEVLACLDRCDHNPFDEIAPTLLNELANISTAIFVFLDWDETRERLVKTAMQSGCSVKVYIVRGKTTTLPLERAEHLVGQVILFTPEEVGRGAYEVL